MTTVHGGDGVRIAIERGLDPASILDLSASLNPAAPDVARIVAAHLDTLARYPDPGPATAALAHVLDVPEKRVLLTNGGAEAIALVAAELGAGWVEEPDFALYRRYLAALEPNAPRWRSDPHNPTGTLAGPTDRAGVWDEAFYPLATGTWISGRDAVLLGSLTKVFACPGLRIGFVLAEEDLIGALTARQPQWSVNGLAAAALPDLIAAADIARWADEVRRLREELTTVLRANGLRPLPSAANYVLVPDAPGVRDTLLEDGVVVRDCASFGLPDHVRIAVPDDAGRRRLARALEQR